MSVWNQVAKEYGSVGPNYWNWFGQKLVDFAELEVGNRILDIGCGRGASLFPAAKVVGSSGFVHGIDLSEKMIEYTQIENPFSTVQLSHGDLQVVNNQEESYDNILCGFGLGYFEANPIYYDIVKKNLKKGGSISFSVWTHQEDQTWMNELVQNFLPPPKPHKTSHDMTTSDGLQNLLNERGFICDKINMVEQVFVFESPEVWWSDLKTTAVKHIMDLIEEKHMLADFKEKALKEVVQFQVDHKIHIKRQALLVRVKDRG